MNKIILTLVTVLLSMVFANAQTTEKEVKFGGRIMYDMATWGAEEFDNTGAEFRRVRLYSSGEIYGTVKYKLQLDFSAGKISFKDVWMELNKLPVKGNIRVGHFKEPLRLEALTSSKYITFMERGLPIAMSPERNTGAMYHTTIGKKLSLQTGIFRQSDDFGNDKTANNNINITSRASYLAINDGNKLLHLGVANSKRKSNDKSYNFSSRAENHLGNKLISVNKEQVNYVNIFSGEMSNVSARATGRSTTSKVPLPRANNSAGFGSRLGSASRSANTVPAVWTSSPDWPSTAPPSSMKAMEKPPITMTNGEIGKPAKQTMSIRTSIPYCGKASSYNKQAV